MTPEEIATLSMIADRADRSKPRCTGPLVVHLDGSFECHGVCAEGPESGLLAFYHDEDAPGPCSVELRRHVEPLGGFRTRCKRCRS